MKPAPFDYHAPSTVEEAVGLLAELGDGAKVLAGGQSLVPMLALRLAVFDHLVDLGRIDELRGIERAERRRVDRRGHDPGRDRGVTPRSRDRVPLLARATPLIGHFQIRNRGTVGGSIAHADPAAEYPAVALALDAELEAASPRGRRTIAGARLLQRVCGPPTWQPDELLTGVRFPVWGGRCGLRGRGARPAPRRLRHRRRGGLGASSTATTGSSAARSGCSGSARRRSGPTAAEAAVAGSPVGDVGRGRGRGGWRCRRSSPIPSDLHGSDAYRRRVGAAMVARAWTRAVEEASRV